MEEARQNFQPYKGKVVDFFSVVQTFSGEYTNISVMDL